MSLKQQAQVLERDAFAELLGLDLATQCKPSQGMHQKILPPTCFLKLTAAIFS